MMSSTAALINNGGAGRFDPGVFVNYLQCIHDPLNIAAISLYQIMSDILDNVKNLELLKLGQETYEVC